MSDEQRPVGARDLDEVVAWSMVRASRRLANTLAETLAPFELTTVQFGVLAQLGVEALLSQAELANRVQVRHQSMSHLLDVLTARGLVERTGPGGSGRPNPVRLTTAGDALLGRAWPTVRETSSAAALSLSDTDRSRLVGILRQLLQD